MSDNNLLLFKTIFSQSPVSTQVFNLDGETVMVNDAWEKLWNIKFKELKHYNVLHDKQLEKKGIMKYVKRGFKGMHVDVPAIEYVPSQTVSVKNAVASKWVSARMYPIKNEKDKITYIVIQHEDISQKKVTEELNARLAAIIESSDDAIISKTLTSIIKSWNPSAEKLFGYNAKEAIGKHIGIIIPDEHIKEEDVIIRKLKRGERVEHFETIRKKKNGEKMYVSLSISPIKDSSGKVVGASKIARDITQQKEDEQALRESETRLRLALDAGDIGVWDWNLVNDALIWSEKVYEIHGIADTSMKMDLQAFSKFIHEDDKKNVNEAIAKALKGTQEFSTTFRIVLPTGEARWIKTSATVIRDAKGKPLHMLGATSDISKEKKLAQDKNDFIGIATHELKTPVTSLKAYAEALQRKFARQGDMLSSTQLGKMNAQLDKLTTLISDLLDVTKIESGKLRMHQEKFDFDEFVGEIVEELQRTTDRHKLTIEGKTKKKITADRERVGQVLTNLISNAIKYSPHADRIIIKPLVVGKQVQVCVQDFGVGIPSSKLDRLFERFYRISGPKENTFPGLGLGLYISSEIIKRQQGRIWVESKPGKGSNFCFILPIVGKVKKVKDTLAEEEIRHE